MDGFFTVEAGVLRHEDASLTTAQMRGYVRGRFAR